MQNKCKINAKQGTIKAKRPQQELKNEMSQEGEKYHSQNERENKYRF